MAQPDLAAVPPRGELEPNEGVDGHQVGLDAAHVAEDDRAGAPLEKSADTLAESGQVGAGNRAADGERDRLRR